MEDDLPDLVRDYKLKTLFTKKREVVHICDDPDAPPWSQPRKEHWKSEKRPIGGGGQGQVFLQKCTSGGQLDAHRAVKMIPYQEGSGKKRYIEELKTIIRFSHPRYSTYFAKSLGWYESLDSLCIAMEYFPGGDLQSYIDRNRLPEDHSRHVISQVLRGLEIMHQEGFKHGDIKPKNILIKQCPTPEVPHTWWVKLADFGISKRVKEASGASTRIGTPEYMAPELYVERRDVNYQAADMWALGATAFRMLTQTSAFSDLREACSYLEGSYSLFSRAPLNGCHVGQDGQDFIHALLSKPDQRLKPHEALRHAWVRSCMPSAPATTPTARGGSSPPSSTPSSSASSRRSSLDKERSMATYDSRTQPTISTIPRNSSYEDIDKQTSAVVTAASMMQPNDKPDSLTPSQESHDTPLPTKVREGTNGQHSTREQLLQAAMDGHEAVVKLLLEQGVNLESKAKISNRTPLSWAAEDGHEAVVKLLLEKGANLESRGKFSRTPLSWAAKNGHEAVVKLLLEKGANLESKDKCNRTPLWWAAKNGHKEVVKLLLEKGANRKSKDKFKRTPLSWAAENGHGAVVELLQTCALP